MPNNSVVAVKTYKALKDLGIREAYGYFQKFSEFLIGTKASFMATGSDMDIGKCEGKLIECMNRLIILLADYLFAEKRIMFIGNGGSAGIAMHALADYANAGGFKTIDFYNPALITCISNDYGYENVFAKQIEFFSKPGDMLFAISSSGKSPNILMATEAAKARGCYVVTFSGFDANNPLRKAGHTNFYTPSTHYGFVELAHQTLIHCILDLFIRNKIYEEEREAVG